MDVQSMVILLRSLELCLESAQILRGRRLDSDCYSCWLTAPSQPCLLSAGLSSIMDLSLSFSVSVSLFGLPDSVLDSDFASQRVPGKLSWTWNASLCRQNLIHSGLHPLACNTQLRRVTKKDFEEETLSQAFSCWLIFLPSCCECGTRNTM